MMLTVEMKTAMGSRAVRLLLITELSDGQVHSSARFPISSWKIRIIPKVYVRLVADPDVLEVDDWTSEERDGNMTAIEPRCSRREEPPL